MVDLGGFVCWLGGEGGKKSEGKISGCGGSYLNGGLSVRVNYISRGV